MMFPKPKKIRDKNYLEWIKDHDCYFLCNRYLHRIDPHHLDRSNDYTCVPLCRIHHTMLHATAPSDWPKKFGFDKDKLWELTRVLQRQYGVDRIKE